MIPLMSDDRPSLSRRELLQQGAAAAAVGTLIGMEPANAFGQAPAVVTARRFRGWVTRGGGPGRTTLQELTLRPISGRQIVVRTEATNLCYSNVPAVLALPPPAPPAGGAAPATGPGRGAAAGPGGRAGGAPPPGAGGRAGGPPAGAAGAPPAGRGGFGGPPRAIIQGHGGVGVVEAVGPQVRRVQVGDRVCVSGTPQCGSCYQCLRGRADMCQFLSDNNLVPIADLSDGAGVVANSHIGGLAELMVTTEEWVVPIFTKASPAALGMVCSCVTVAGLGATTSPTLALVQPGSSVAVVGCGPLGLSAVIGAKIAGASTIIAIDPIRARRELALKVGATQTLDPNVEGNNLVARVRELTRFPNDRFWSGGRTSGGLLGGAGADFVIEAAGADAVTPKLEAGPDPTGILPMRQAYEMTAPGGHIVTTSLPRGNITLSGVLFSIGGRTHHAGQAGGAQPMRDIPRFVEMLDKGQFNAAALATTVIGLEGMLEAYEQVAYRTTVTAIMTP
jgi:S-(hydroxymethyl)glutathione dehydrogenase/alcohol dehydrogenase